MLTRDLATRPLMVLMLSHGVSLAAQEPADRSLLWGDQHVHTSWSLDAFAFGNRLTGPEDFYRYAKGEPVRHSGGQMVRISQPLDWGAVTEHSDYMGLVQQASDPDSPLRKHSSFLSGVLRVGMDKDPMLTFKALTAAIALDKVPDVLSSEAVMAPVWEAIVKAADDHYQPGSFTTFAAFEWTSTPQSNNLHRNVLFRDSGKVPAVPYTTFESSNPRDLWSWMDQQRKRGNEALAISHNGNLSSGHMYPRELDETGEPLSAEWSQARLRNEPLSEIKQGKGQSETTPGLSPNDEFANYEVFIWQLMGAEGAPVEKGSYVRQAYRDGLALRQGKGFNPYQFGLAGGADTHVTVAPYRQDNYFGMHGDVDDTIEERVAGNVELGLNSHWITPAGLTAVWADGNNRESIFDALRRRETYATTGVRIHLRFFGGWDLESLSLDDPNWVKSAYQSGVPMGGELSEARSPAPSFALWASRDPDGANLDRLQIVKGWSVQGQSFEKIYDVAWSGDRSPDETSGELPLVGNTVSLRSGQYSNTIGASELRSLWRDPDFDPTVDAFYYVRVLEIPTPRWSTIQAAKLGQLPPQGPGFSPAVQERAWSSPIWYKAPEREMEALTVAQLSAEGVKALDDKALQDLITGKTIRVSNQVTGQEVDILYGKEGRRMILAIDGEPMESRLLGEMLHGAGVGYEIKDDRLITRLEGTPLAVRVFAVDGRLLAARDDEFGFVNYVVEVLPEQGI